MVEYIATPAMKLCSNSSMRDPIPLRLCEGDGELFCFSFVTQGHGLFIPTLIFCHTEFFKNLTMVDSLTVAGKKAVVYENIYLNGGDNYSHTGYAGAHLLCVQARTKRR